MTSTSKRGPKPKFTEADIKNYGEQHNCSYNEALYRLRMEHSTTPRAVFINSFVKLTGKSIAAGDYAWSKVQKGESYDPLRIANTDERNRHELSEFKGFTVEYNPTLDGYNYDIKLNGELRPIQHHGDRLFIYNPNTQDQVSVATVVYCLYNQEGIPGGFVVDHIDNNVLNNNPENLQLITWAENIRKNAVGHNQFTNKKGDK